MAKISSDTLMTDKPRLSIDEVQEMLYRAKEDITWASKELELRAGGVEAETLPEGFDLPDLEPNDSELVSERLSNLRFQSSLAITCVEHLSESAGYLEHT